MPYVEFAFLSLNSWFGYWDFYLLFFINMFIWRLYISLWATAWASALKIFLKILLWKIVEIETHLKNSWRNRCTCLKIGKYLFVLSLSSVNRYVVSEPFENNFRYHDTTPRKKLKICPPKNKDIFLFNWNITITSKK